jgi:hypothetical protein
METPDRKDCEETKEVVLAVVCACAVMGITIALVLVIYFFSV